MRVEIVFSIMLFFLFVLFLNPHQAGGTQLAASDISLSSVSSYKPFKCSGLEVTGSIRRSLRPPEGSGRNEAQTSCFFLLFFFLL